MGIRINKDIGYYLPKKNINKVLVKKYDDILDDMYHIDQDFIEKMSIEFDILTAGEDKIGFIVAKLQMKALLKSKNPVEFNTFVKSIYDYDTFKGMLFQTPDLAKSSHFDDLIDYYEQVENPVFVLNLLQQSIYPDSYYMCVKVPELTEESLNIYAQTNPRKPILEVGDLVTADTVNYTMLYSNIATSNGRVKKWAYPNKGKEKYFHPYINILTYVAGKVAGIIKPEITYIEFAQYLEPAIVTHWG